MRKLFIIFPLIFILTALHGQQKQTNSLPVKGMYFTKKEYKYSPLPVWDSTKELLPRPVYDENPLLVELYYKAWSIAFQNFYRPSAASGFVSAYPDASFNDNVFLWDGCFISMFCNYGYPYVPGISGLDNFYCKQYPDGEICREINRKTGEDFSPWMNKEVLPLFSRWRFEENGNLNQNAFDTVHYMNRQPPSTPSFLTLDALNHPIAAWAELESYRVTGDRGRLQSVYLPLKKYYEALNLYLRQGNGLYITDWASMDNSARNTYIRKGGTAIDISCEMAMFTRNLREIAIITGKYNDTAALGQDARQLSVIINKKMWDQSRKFYFDLKADDQLSPVKTIAAFWALIADVAETDQAKCLVEELRNPQTFCRTHRVPTLAATEKGYNPLGGYWKGSVWAPTNTMIIRGLEKYGYDSLAYEIAMNDLNAIASVFKNTGTIWENYAADSIMQGDNSQKDFVGWSGMAPILYFLEFAIGIKPDAAANTLKWNIRSNSKSGCESYRFNGHLISLLAEPADKGKIIVTIVSDGNFKLVINLYGQIKTFNINSGAQVLKI